MRLFTEIFVKNKCIFLTILLQQQLALVIRVFSSFWIDAGLRPKKCGAGWDGLRGGFKFCGAGADTKFQPAQDSSGYLETAPKFGIIDTSVATSDILT